ncbi:MAG: family 10 glycosylhydrolase [Victivallaceae bacterium]|nr:family 10 glycosylhydrolase [Victivallaceae bacterium]
MKKLPFIFAIVLAALTLSAQTLTDQRGHNVRRGGDYDRRPVEIPDRYTPRRAEMRGVWAATVENIDFDRCNNAQEFKTQFRRMVAQIRRRNFNALFFQVRPMNDAFYPSRLNPWSRWLTGEEGHGMGGFDPLEFMTSECRKNGIEFHAWLNPYRVNNGTKLGKQAYLNTLSSNNFARKHPECVLSVTLPDGRNNLFLDPGHPLVARHIVETVAEIVGKYDVAGIHFDDYFYPYGGTGDADRASFTRYNPRRLSRSDWRRDNVNRVIRDVHETVKDVAKLQKRKIEFGVSPFGIWGNAKELSGGSPTGGKQSYSAQYADSRAWVKNGWVDYIAPQLYWDFGHERAAFAGLVDWWCATVRGTGVRLYIGQGIHRLGSWPGAELHNQMSYLSAKPEVSGSIFYSYRRVTQPETKAVRNTLEQLFREMWNKRVPVKTGGLSLPPFK